MKRLKESIRNMSIRRKIILYTYLVITPILVLICVAVTGYRYVTSKENYHQMQKAGINTLADSLDIIRQETNYLSLTISINQEIRNVLEKGDPGKLNQDTKLWANYTPVQFLEETIFLKGYIKTISVYPENGVSPYLKCIDFTSYFPTIGEIRETPEYQRALELKGKGFWIKEGKGSGTVYQANREEKLVLCREVFDMAKKNPLGFVTVGISEETIENLCANVLLSEEEGMILFDHSQKEITTYGEVDQSIKNFVRENDLFPKEEALESYDGQELYLKKISEGGWYICKVIPRKDFWYFFKDIIYIPLLLLLGIVLGLLPIMLLVSNIISKPLETVCEAMGKFRQGDFGQQVEMKSKDEVGQVAACFNQMVVDIEQLINKNYIMVLKERESELAILQAQINPHFLYNALDSIYWQATDVGDEETAESIYQLSQLFRLVLGQGKDWVTVEMEAELLKRYLEIQKLRFSQQLDFCIDIEQEILGEKIPKLILQPFVENAVIHGSENSDTPCMITVTGRRREAFMEFQIRDTGVGMTEEQLKKIWEEEAEKVYTGQRVGRYAIRNVRERLELRYGTQFRLKVESKKGQGTTVIVAVPLNIKEEEYGNQIVDRRG